MEATVDTHDMMVVRGPSEADEMKDRICIAIAIVSVLINCFFGVGCSPPPGYITIDSGSALMNPTFCMYKDPYFQEPLSIRRITVEKALRSSEKKNRWALDSPLNDRQTVWQLELKFPDTDSIIVAILARLTTSTVSCLTYGVVPPDYEEKVKALPLEPEELYILSVDAAYYPRQTAPLRFIIRLNGAGVPDRLEYRLGIPLYVGGYLLSDAISSESRLKCFLGSNRQTGVESESSMRWRSGSMVYVMEISMNVLIKVLSRSIVGVLTLGLLGCGCLFPSTSNTLQKLYVKLYSEAEDLRYDGEYRAAVEKYEQAFKYRSRSTKVIDVSFLALFKYRIAFCYTKLAEAEENVSLYIKAEAAVKESYQTAILESDHGHILYLWGYILFKQARYEEARAKYEAAIEIFLQQREERSLMGKLYTLGKVYLELGDEAAARRIFAQLEAQIDDIEHGIMYGLGKAYMELDDEAAARRVFAQLEARDYIRYDVMYRLGQAYLELDDEAAARQIFAQLEAQN